MLILWTPSISPSLSFYSFMGSFTLLTTINQYAISGKLVARHSHIFLISSHYYSLQDKIIFANKLRKASVMLNLKVEIYVLSINRSKFMRIVRIFIFLSLHEAWYFACCSTCLSGLHLERFTTQSYWPPFKKSLRKF